MHGHCTWASDRQFGPGRSRESGAGPCSGRHTSAGDETRGSRLSSRRDRLVEAARLSHGNL